MDKNALFNISSGLYIIASADGAQTAACVINTVVQVTESPLQLTVAVNKSTATSEVVRKTGRFTLSFLDQTATFDTIKHFGFQSSRDVDKFKEAPVAVGFKDGLPYLREQVNSVLTCTVKTVTDLGSHYLILATVDGAEVVSQNTSLTYDYYQKNVKPKPRSNTSKKIIWRCEVCGFEIEADELPADYICPLCGHGIDAFVKIEPEI